MSATLTITSASLAADGKTLTVNIGGIGTGPLLPATGVTGFVVKVSGTAVAQSTATAGASVVTITLASAVTMNLTTTADYTPGNLTDSAANTMPASTGNAVVNYSAVTATGVGGVIISDAFSRANTTTDTSANSTISVGNGWTDQSPAYYINGNNLLDSKFDGSTNFLWRTASTDWCANQMVVADLVGTAWPDSLVRGGAQLRRSDSANFYFFQFTMNSNNSGAGSIYRKASAAQTTLTLGTLTGSLAAASGITYEQRFKAINVNNNTQVALTYELWNITANPPTMQGAITAIDTAPTTTLLSSSGWGYFSNVSGASNDTKISRLAGYNLSVALSSVTTNLTPGVSNQSIVVTSSGSGAGVSKWTTTNPTFTLTNSGSNASIVSQTINSDTQVTLVVNTGSTSGTPTITDPTTTTSLSIPITGSGTALSLTGPTTGQALRPSTAFTVSPSPTNSMLSSAVTVTPSDGGAGGTFSPSTLALSAGTGSGTFTYTPPANPSNSSVSRTISITNNGGLTNIGTVTYVATVQSPYLPTLNEIVQTSVGDGIINLSVVTPSYDNGPYTYAWLRSTSASMSNAVSVGSNSPTLSDTGLTNGTAYFYTIRVTDANGQYTVGTLNAATPKKPLVIGTTGDSLTAGAYGINPNEGTALGYMLEVMAGGTYGVTISNQAKGGSTTTNWLPTDLTTSTDGTTATNYFNVSAAAYVAAGVKLITIMLGTNDGLAVSQHQANLQAIINGYMASVPNATIMLHYNPFQPGIPSNGAVFEQYHAAVDALVVQYATSNPGKVIQGDKALYAFTCGHQERFQDSTHPDQIGAYEFALHWAKAVAQGYLGLGVSGGAGVGTGAAADAAVFALDIANTAVSLSPSGFSIDTSGTYALEEYGGNFTRVERVGGGTEAYKFVRPTPHGFHTDRYDASKKLISSVFQLTRE